MYSKKYSKNPEAEHTKTTGSIEGEVSLDAIRDLAKQRAAAGEPVPTLEEAIAQRYAQDPVSINHAFHFANPDRQADEADGPDLAKLRSSLQDRLKSEPDEADETTEK